MECGILNGKEVIAMKKTLGISISEEDIQKVDDAAWRARKNRSVFIRDIVLDYIGSHSKKKENLQEAVVPANL